MAASPWVIYNQAKKSLMQGDIDLDSVVLHMGLYTSASNAATPSLVHRSQLTNELSQLHGYLTGGKILNYTWDVGELASEYKLTCDPIIWAISGGNFANILFAVIWAATPDEKLLCFSQLSSSPFIVSSGNTLTITPAAIGGIFELV